MFFYISFFVLFGLIMFLQHDIYILQNRISELESDDDCFIDDYDDDEDEFTPHETY